MLPAKESTRRRGKSKQLEAPYRNPDRNFHIALVATRILTRATMRLTLIRTPVASCIGIRRHPSLIGTLVVSLGLRPSRNAFPAILAAPWTSAARFADDEEYLVAETLTERVA